MRKCPRPEWAQNADTYFVWACAVKMHVNISQEPPLCENLQGQCRGPEWAQNADTHFVRACAIHFHARQHFTRAAFVREFTGTMPGPRVSPERRHTLCASLRSRNALGDFSCTSLRSGNALGDFTRATLYGTLQVKGHGPAGAPWSSTGLYHYRKNPSVWTRCLGNHKADKQSKQSRIFRIKPLPALERNRLRAVPPFWIAWWQKASGNRNSSQKMDRTVTWHVMTCHDMLWQCESLWHDLYFIS